MSCERCSLLMLMGLEPGASLADLKNAFKELRFIWHPDRQPEWLKKKASDMYCRIVTAYEYFITRPEELAHAWKCECRSRIRNEPRGDFAIELETCPRCEGKKHIFVGVDTRCEFLSGPCPVCCGSGFILVDPRNRCNHCAGSGKNPGYNIEDIREFVMDRLGDTSRLTKQQLQFRYKKSLIAFFNSELLCRHCNGTGYFYFRMDQRSQPMVAFRPAAQREERRERCS
ncbi:MAG: hypothetical protein HQL31_07470 [Planctomycetes bacterium]|nr:hypothetical protein [Planctomycetota bacterium]